MAERGDLWGAEFDTGDLVPPVTLLKEQAAILGARTNYTLSGRVDTSHNGSQVIHEFLIVARALDNYEYQVFRAWHDIDLYPVQVNWNNTLYKAEDEDLFQQLLGRILSSESTLKVVRSLLAQSQA